MDKQDIINEIQRTAKANGGAPLGSRKFATETGIREQDWKGKLWARWSDAVQDAGYMPNEMRSAYSELELLEKYARLALQLGRLPAVADTRLSTRQGVEFPEWNTFTKRFGDKPRLIAKLREYCESRAEFSTVAEFCLHYAPRQRTEPLVEKSGSAQIGFVYLMKSAKHYKIGKANATGRRHRELAIQMPERLNLVHEIKTDDPFGIEAYWHNRFADKRRNGEWFELSAADVAAFKRRKFK